MAETFPIFTLTQEAYAQLRLFAQESPKEYLNPEINFEEILAARGITNYVEETKVFSDRPISLTPVSEGPRNRADRQALNFYNALTGVTPSAATDERMWAWMTHFRLHSYSLQRWRIQSNTNLVNYIRSHWFVENSSEGLWMYNTAARTWWIAHTAIKAANASGGAFTAQEALDDFSNFAVHYHLLITKFVFVRHPIVHAELVRVLLNEAQGIKAEDGLYVLMRRLNHMSGTQILDMMPRDQLRTKILEHTEEVMSDSDLVADRTKLRNHEPFRSLNLGAGVQSTVLALMADRGEYGLPRPDVAIFADTGWEPPEVYAHLEWLKSELSFEVITVEAGNIKDNILAGVRPNGKSYLGIPAHLENPDGTLGVSKRQCTDDYKIRPIQNWLRERLELKHGRRAPKGIQVEMWLGISVDEITRQKESRDEWITKRYPLIERGFSRAQLLEWFNKNYPDRYLPRSSCIGCPYKSDAEWKRLIENDPVSFQDAVFVDRALREIPIVSNAITANGGKAYLHQSRIPLAEVDFSTTTDYDSLMAEECEGLCGI